MEARWEYIGRQFFDITITLYLPVTYWQLKLLYNGKFSRGPIFAVFTDDRLTANIKPVK